MANEQHPEPEKVGIAGLPKRWAVAVQLVGTFGLAVFLVLYYVLVMQPREAERYEQLSESVARLRDSVMSLEEIITSQQSLITREQESRLEDLFTMALSHEIVTLTLGELNNDTTPQELEEKIEDRLIFQTRLFEGLRRKDGGTISEMLTHKIRNSSISQQIAQRAGAGWRSMEPEAAATECREVLDFAIKRAAMAK